MKKVLYIDDDKFYSDMYRTAFKIHALQMEYYASTDILTANLLQETKKIKPNIILVNLENEYQIESGMKLIKAIRQADETKNAIIAAFINSWAKEDYSLEELKSLGVVELWDKIDTVPSRVVVEKIMALK